MTILAATALAGPNSLSRSEERHGWKLLFDGKSTTGWHTFRESGVRPGWQVQDDALVCVDPHTAADLVTDADYKWFELKIDYKLAPGSNSGIMFHVGKDGGATWVTGPEIQLHDRMNDSEPQKTGWLYALYTSAKNSTKPEGEWNSIRIIVAPKKCETYVNGVKYYDYVLNSDDFKARVAKSKFGQMPSFATLESGAIALQGDHGVVSFRNIKIRPISE